jgi:hypothetical protein
MINSTLVQDILHQNQKLGLATGQVQRIKIRGFSIAEDVCVQIKEDGIVVECNHAGSHTEMLTQNAGMDDERTVETTVCDRCPAQLIGEEWVL